MISTQLCSLTLQLGYRSMAIQTQEPIYYTSATAAEDVVHFAMG